MHLLPLILALSTTVLAAPTLSSRRLDADPPGTGRCNNYLLDQSIVRTIFGRESDG
jgi:hypothetical protein